MRSRASHQGRQSRRFNEEFHPSSVTPVTPVASVVLPVQNAEKWIAACLNSLDQQNFQDFETVLIDDGCTDSTVPIAQSLGLSNLRVVQGRKEGLAAALALGVNVSRGEYIIRQDADDVSHHERFERQIAYLEAHPECVALGTSAQLIAEDGRGFGRISPPVSDRAIRLRMTIRSPFIHPSMAIRRKALLNAGNYQSPNSDPYAEDYDLWARLARQGTLANLSDQLIQYRVTTQGVSRARWHPIAKSAQAIAADSMQMWLDRELSDSERELVGMFHGRSRRISVSEALTLLGLLFAARVKAGPHIVRRAMPIGDVLRPIAWVFADPRQMA